MSKIPVEDVSHADLAAQGHASHAPNGVDHVGG